MKTVLITGISRRLGLYLVRAFLGDNFKVIGLTRIVNDELNKLSKNNNLQVITTNYTDINSLKSAILQIENNNNKIDLVIHNASLFDKDANHSQDLWQYYDVLYQTHMKMPAFINENLYKLLKNKKTPGCIIHITDISVINPVAKFALYCSTKAGLENLSKSYAKKFAPFVRVNSILPGPMLFLPSHTKEEKLAVAQQTLLSVEPGFLPILEGIKFIFENQFITGSSIKIDGGRSIANI